MHPKVKGAIWVDHTDSFEGTVIYCCKKSQTSVYSKTHVPCSNTKGSEGIGGRDFPSRILYSPKLISFPGSSNRIGQRHLAVSGWDFGNSLDEPLPPMRLQQPGSSRRAASLIATLAWVKARQEFSWTWGCGQITKGLDWVREMARPQLRAWEHGPGALATSLTNTLS